VSVYKIYLLSQSRNNGYDTYDSCVVIAKSPKEAKEFSLTTMNSFTWVSSEEHIECKKLGVAQGDYKAPLIPCASFNAG
jgi:hypothetical protein